MTVVFSESVVTSSCADQKGYEVESKLELA